MAQLNAACNAIKNPFESSGRRQDPRRSGCPAQSRKAAAPPGSREGTKEGRKGTESGKKEKAPAKKDKGPRPKKAPGEAKEKKKKE